MQPGTGRCHAYGVVFFIVVLAAMLVPFQGSAQAPAAGVMKRTEGLTLTDPKNPADRTNPNLSGTVRWNIFENARVIVDARTYGPGQRTDLPGKYHPENYDVVTILLTPGRVEMNAAGDEVETGDLEAGHMWWWPKSPPGGHSIANVGTQPFTYLNIRLKEPPRP
jgi:hypothetical protein